MSLHHFPRFRLSYLIQMTFLLSTLSAALANPVSSPEIATTKSGKSIASAIVGNGNSLQQQQQKSSPQDAHLNSLTVYATNFDSITSGNPQQSSGNFKPSYNYNSNSNSNYNSNSNSNSNNNYNSNSNNNYNSNSNSNNNYNSNSNSNNNYNTNSNSNSNYISNTNDNNNYNSNTNDNNNYNSNRNSNSISNNNFNNENHNSYMPLPEIETNFTPMQQGTIQTSDLSQPVIMQYLPQTVHASDGIQYLQLIPTRPLMVPISSYITGAPGAQIAADVGATVSNNVGYHHHHQPPTLAAPNTIAEYATRTPPILNPQLTVNVAAPSPSVLMDIPTTHSYGGLPAYAPQIMHPYRHFRINRDIKPKHLPPGLSLNLHEYMPSPHDPPRATFVRGRP